MDSKPSMSGQYLTFQLRSELFGIPIGDVREINQHGEVTPVPKSPESVKGVMNLRGKIIPVVNLRIQFGMQEQEVTKESCIIVIDTDAGQVGVVVDSVKEVIQLSDDQIDQTPGVTKTGNSRLVRGVAKLEKNVILLVEIKSTIESEKLNEIRAAA